MLVKKSNLVFSQMLIFALFFSAKSFGLTLKCQNFFYVNGKKRVVEFESRIKESPHLPDAKFIIDTTNAKAKVTEVSGETRTVVAESKIIERLLSYSWIELVIMQNQTEKYFLWFHRNRIIMKITYRDGNQFIESSAKTSQCSLG